MTRRAGAPITELVRLDGVPLIKCSHHGTGKPWLICEHVKHEGVPPKLYQAIEDDDELAGEALCAKCAGDASEGEDSARLTCEMCVLVQLGQYVEPGVVVQ